jgi:anti-sigma factor RsiW
MANTENIEAKLCAYVDGELDPAGRAEIEAHLTANPQHRQLMAELMQQRDLLGGLPRERAPGGFV